MGLRDLVEDYVVSLELGQHKKVSELSSKICAKLIATIDDYLIERPDDDDDDDDDDSSSEGKLNTCDRQLVHAIGSICDRIRKYDDIAVAYHDVRSFVHLYDMVCLSRMAGAIPHKQLGAGEQPEHELPIDVEFLAYIMRSACALLRYMNEDLSTAHWPSASEEPQTWIDVRQQIDKICSIGFPIYTLNIEESMSSFGQQFGSGESFVDHFRSICVSAADNEHYASNELSQILASRWFQQFLDMTLSQRYPLDRFSSSIALWIVADICQCGSLEQMMSELVDRIFHEESNSCNVEELLQLGSQVGSYWLSYHRRYRTTFAGATSLDLDEDEQDEDVLSNTSAGSENLTEVDDKLAVENLRADLRRLIKNELLEGPNCLFCGSRPREPLACLRKPQSCPGCHSETSWAEDFCAISRRALPLIRLNSLKRQLKSEKLLVLVNQSEWTRHALDGSTNKFAKLPANRTKEKKETSERIDIEANFERLTIIRDDTERQEGSDEYESLDDEDAGDQDELVEMKSTLRAFMASIDSHRDLSASESIKMLRFLFGGQSERYSRSSNVFLCSSDFLILDQQDDWKQVELRLLAVNSLVLLSDGSLWICSARSSVSKLRLGCGRLFSSLELLRHPKTSAKLDSFICCFCQRGLKKLSLSAMNYL